MQFYIFTNLILWLHHYIEELEDKSRKDRQHNGQKKMDKKTTNNDLQSTTTQKTKDRAKRTPLKTGGELECSGRVSSSARNNFYLCMQF